MTKIPFCFRIVVMGFLLILQSVCANEQQAPVRQNLNFNSDWLLSVGDPSGASEVEFDDSLWQPVTLPHAWNEDDAFHVDIHHHRTGIAWYRKHFKLPETTDGKKVFIEFEGVRQLGEIWINGQYVGSHENGVMAFGFDVTRFVKLPPENNVIAVRTDNSWDYSEKVSGQGFQWADQNFNANYGGIPKNVILHLTSILHQTLPLYSNLGTTGVYVYATDIDVKAGTAIIHAESEVSNEPRPDQPFTYEVTIKDPHGKIVKQFSGGSYVAPGRGRVVAHASAPLEDLHFWSWGYGYLYTVTTVLKVDGKVVDSVQTKTGFRKTEFGEGVVKLNDRILHIKGYAQRTSNEWPALGVSVPPWLSDYSNGLMVESGANLVRWMHITPWKQDVESCDRVGLMQMLPAGDSERDAVGRKWTQRMDVMRDAIIYNRNNPSVLVYESGNNGISEEHMAEMKAIRDRYDPYGGRAIGSRDMLGSKEAEYGGEMLYVNKSARQPFWQTEYSRDEGLRKYWDNDSPPFHQDGDGPLYRDRPAREYNRNQDTHAIEDVVRWYDFWRERPGTGKRVNGGALNIVFSDTNTHYRGAENYRRSGEVDAMRIPKDGFFAHQVMWDGWVDVENPQAHILGHWNYTSNVVKDINVVSSAQSVELFINGQSMGLGEQNHQFLFTFHDISWKPGVIKAVGYDKIGNKVCESSHETAGNPVSLRLKMIHSPIGLRADGADVAIAEVEVIDAQGRRCPTAMNTINFELEGPAEWRGGIAQGPNNYILSKHLPVECGVNRVILRSKTTPGVITLYASSPGLAPAQIQIQSHPFYTKNGLSEIHPQDGLPLTLQRGPTPEGSSVTPTRRSVSILHAKAGSNEEQCIQSYDDNELTSWTSKNDVSSAWIEYKLDRSAKLIEASFKMTGFRSQSYPIRILVDGVEAFRGVTERSLGYVTLSLGNVCGQTVRIELLGTGESADAYNISELLDQANAASGSEEVMASMLSIIEVEFYESLQSG